jgi:prevent-host-death family protein
MTTDIQEAKVRLAELVKEAARGADVIITVDGVPQARLTPVAPASAKRWDVRKYAEFWKNKPVDNSRPSSTELIREDRDGRD